MKTSGEILKTARNEQQISLLEAEEATKIRQQYLLALENDDLVKFPDMVTAQGFLKNYCEFLKVDPESTLAIFRRDYIAQKPATITVNKENRLSYWLKFRGWPYLSANFWLVILFLVVIVYLIFQSLR